MSESASKAPAKSAGLSRSRKAAPHPKTVRRQAASPDEPMLDIGGKAHKATDLQRTAGNHAVTRAIESGAGLRAAPPDGRYEHDADRIGQEATSAPEGVVGYFASRFGLDAGSVRVHSGEGAAGQARAFGAKAFTSGRDIVFGAGRYQPGTSEGRRLLAHELAHAVQQTSGAVAGPVVQREGEDKPVPFGKKYEQKRARSFSYEEYKEKIGSSTLIPPIQAASEFERNDGTGKAHEHGTKISPIEISLPDLRDIMNPPGEGHVPQVDNILMEYRASINLAFTTMKMDTSESQALYLAHAAGETGSFLKLEEKTIQWKSYKGFEGRGPVQVTGEYNYVQTIAYMEKDAELLRNSANPQDRAAATRLKQAADAIRADPGNAADPRYTFLFSGAYMQMAGGIRRSPQLKGGRPDFPGTAVEDNWVSDHNNKQELADARLRLAKAQATLAGLNAADPDVDKKKLDAAKKAVTTEKNAVQEWDSTVKRSVVKAATFQRAIRVLSKKDVSNPNWKPEPQPTP